MPGVLTLEAMGQVASILAMANLGDKLEGKIVLFAYIAKTYNF
jgi:3-hydroxymyristoyl/3-hydroxydecanoyl-(acyl carrier protein) dehydratase